MSRSGVFLVVSRLHEVAMTARLSGWQVGHSQLDAGTRSALSIAVRMPLRWLMFASKSEFDVYRSLGTLLNVIVNSSSRTAVLK